MEYSKLLDLASDIGYRLAMSGAETFRVEESITRILSAYEIEAEVFAIPNCLHISIEPVSGRPLTRMRRIGSHGNDLDALERYSALSRRICAQKPAPEIARSWLEEVQRSKRTYPAAVNIVAYFFAAFGFCFLFGGSFVDALCSGICGLVVGILGQIADQLGANLFFRTIAASFPMALAAYAFAALGVAGNPDAVIIGALMQLVPGLLFTNAMRDIIYGDTNSGVNRIVQVLLIAAAISLGTAAAWGCANTFWGAPVSDPNVSYSILAQALPCALACLAFSVLFNIHGAGGILCVLGGVITWSAYCLVLQLGGDDLSAYFWAGLIASVYSEIMARVRKYPATSYLVVSIFPLIPGAGVYYTMSHAVRGDMDLFASQGMHTAAIAGVIAVSILLISTSFRLWSVWKQKKVKTSG